MSLVRHGTRTRPFRRTPDLEAERESTQVSQTDATVALRVEGVEVARAAPTRPERTAKDGPVAAVHVAVAVGVAEPPGEGRGGIAARGPIIVAVEGAAGTVVNPVTMDDERVVAVLQRAAKDPSPRDSQDRHGLLAHDGGGYDQPWDRAAPASRNPRRRSPPDQLERAGIDRHFAVESQGEAPDLRSLGRAV